MSADTWALVEGRIEARPLRELTVKGRVQPVMTYEVLGIAGEARAKAARAARAAPRRPRRRPTR